MLTGAGGQKGVEQRLDVLICDVYNVNSRSTACKGNGYGQPLMLGGGRQALLSSTTSKWGRWPVRLVSLLPRTPGRTEVGQASAKEGAGVPLSLTKG